MLGSILAFFACLISASNTWDYPFPRTIFLNGSYFFGIAALIFFSITFFLDDLLSWIKNLTVFWIRGILTFLFIIAFTSLMTVGFYFTAVASLGLMQLKQCGFEITKEICIKKQAEISSEDLKKILKTKSYQITLGNNSKIKNILGSYDIYKD